MRRRGSTTAERADRSDVTIIRAIDEGKLDAVKIQQDGRTCWAIRPDSRLADYIESRGGEVLRLTQPYYSVSELMALTGRSDKGIRGALTAELQYRMAPSLTTGLRCLVVETNEALLSFLNRELGCFAVLDREAIAAREAA